LNHRYQMVSGHKSGVFSEPKQTKVRLDTEQSTEDVLRGSGAERENREKRSGEVVSDLIRN